MCLNSKQADCISELLTNYLTRRPTLALICDEGGDSLALIQPIVSVASPENPAFCSIYTISRLQETNSYSPTLLLMSDKLPKNEMKRDAHFLFIFFSSHKTKTKVSSKEFS